MGKKLYIRSDGKFVRDYIYVEDIVNAYMLLAKKMLPKGIKGEAFNFSDETPLKVLDKVHKLEQQGRSIIHFELGDPDFQTPSHIIESAYKSMKKGETHYTSSMGLYDMRLAAQEAVALLKTRGFQQGGFPERLCIKKLMSFAFKLHILAAAYIIIRGSIAQRWRPST